VPVTVPTPDVSHSIFLAAPLSHSFSAQKSLGQVEPQHVTPPSAPMGLKTSLTALALAHSALADRAAVMLQHPKFYGLDTSHSSASEVHPALLMAAVAHQVMAAAEHSLPDCVSLTSAAIDDIRCRIAVPFTIDCSALALPSVPHACDNVITSPPAVKALNLAGHTVYMHAPTQVMPDLVKHYLSCKSAAPDLTTKGVFVITNFLLTKHPDLFVGMHKLQTYSKHMPVNLRHWADKAPVLTRTQTPLHVFYDGPITPNMQGVVAATNPPVEEIPAAVLAPTQVCMTFAGLVSGAAATIGLDSYAQGVGYVQPSFVQQHQLSTIPISRVQVLLGDGVAQTSATSACKVHIKMGSFTSIAWLLVMSIPTHLSVLLGDAFLRQHGAHLEYDRKAMVITTPTRQHIIYSLEAQADKAKRARPPVLDTIPTSTPVILSAMQVKRYIRKNKHTGKGMILCIVQQDDDTAELLYMNP